MQIPHKDMIELKQQTHRNSRSGYGIEKFQELMWCEGTNERTRSDSLIPFGLNPTTLPGLLLPNLYSLNYGLTILEKALKDETMGGDVNKSKKTKCDSERGTVCDCDIGTRPSTYGFIGQVANPSLNPVWNQTFDFAVEDGLHEMLNNRRLIVAVRRSMSRCSLVVA
ncbi:synaptotagmin-5 isoform X1 [Senna tora]|uniref:Synaptotagmin-5 isoform X1 n=1 Tax=Senna tora TaxID=362788 RepID=A0A834XH00_9FABA|nr:synaptotagmin-5 isoform X1 [Senna tora]